VKAKILMITMISFCFIVSSSLNELITVSNI
jgi:hypothetical protein